MRVAPRANLTITLLRQQSFGGERFQPLGPESGLAVPAALPVAITGRVDVVALGQRSAEAHLFDCCYVACALLGLPLDTDAPSPAPTPVPPIEPEYQEDEPPPPPRPNLGYEPADGGGVGLLDLLA